MWKNYSPPNLLKREKVFDESGIWIDTKPLVINEATQTQVDDTKDIIQTIEKIHNKSLNVNNYNRLLRALEQRLLSYKLNTILL